MKTHTLRWIIVVCVSLFLLGVFLVGFTLFSTQQPGRDTETPTSQTTNNPPVDSPDTNNNTAVSTPANNQSTPPPQHTKNTAPQVVAVDDPTSTDPTFTTKDGETFPLRTYKLLAANDPAATQWWTTSTGLDTAWNIGTGSYQTTVAVIDTGFSLPHEEFSTRWAINTGETGITATQGLSVLNCTDRGIALDQSCNLIDDNFDGIVDNESGPTTSENPSRLNCTDRSIPLDKSCNLIDDDNNGYADDVTGWDFASYDSSVQAGETNPNGKGTTHGTMVAGILAATGNNSKGIAGVNWATKILPLQAINDDSYGNSLTVAEAIYYAVDRKVDVINLSLGSYDEDPYLRLAVQHALDNDILVVAASGNDGCDCITYPARYPEVFTVGASQPNGTVSTFSNYGAALDIIAPGEGMITTSWSASNSTNGYVSGAAGTSFAAPYISGLLSAMRSHQSAATWGELTSNLLATANHAGLTFDTPSSPLIGSGFVKADAATARATTPASPLLRYGFGSTPLIGTLSSNRAYQCFEAGDFPTAPLYRIARGDSIYYTIDTLDYARALDRGDATRTLGRTCVGLPGDAPSSLRIINLLREIDNINSKRAIL